MVPDLVHGGRVAAGGSCLRRDSNLPTRRTVLHVHELLHVRARHSVPLRDVHRHLWTLRAVGKRPPLLLLLCPRRLYAGCAALPSLVSVRGRVHSAWHCMCPC